MRVLLVALTVFSLGAFGAAPEDFEFVRALHARLKVADCQLRVIGPTGADLLDLSEHHLLDLARIGGDEPLGAAEGALALSARNGFRNRGKTFELFEGYGDVFLRPLREALRTVLREQMQLGPPLSPLYVAIVGLGREVHEPGVLVRILQQEIDNRQIDVERLNLRIGLYDVDSATLRTADQEAAALVRQHPWLRDRIEVRFFDMSAPLIAATWLDRRFALIMARNSLREHLVVEGWPFLIVAADGLVPRGLLAVDSDAYNRIFGPLALLVRRAAILPENFASLFEDGGTFGPRHSEDETFLLRRR